MKNTFNNSVSDFRYHAVITVTEDSLRKYLSTVYEEADLTTLDSLADAVTIQYDELETDWNVRIYDRHTVYQFVEDVRNSMWSRAARLDYTQELNTMPELTFAIYSDCRDTLNDCINHIVEHCEWNRIEGSVSDIVFHVRPIEYGERDF